MVAGDTEFSFLTGLIQRGSPLVFDANQIGEVLVPDIIKQNDHGHAIILNRFF